MYLPYMYRLLTLETSVLSFMGSLNRQEVNRLLSECKEFSEWVRRNQGIKDIEEVEEYKGVKRQLKKSKTTKSL